MTNDTLERQRRVRFLTLRRLRLLNQIAYYRQIAVRCDQRQAAVTVLNLRDQLDWLEATIIVEEGGAA